MKIKLTATLLILFLPFFLYIFSGCCDCQDSDFLNYTNCSFELKNLDNSGASIVITEENQIAKSAFGLQIQLERKEDVCQIRKPLFISTAYGTSCDCPPSVVYQPLNEITNIKFITLQDFDNNHLANTDITEYFQALNSTEYISVSDYISNQQLELPYDLNSPLNTNFLLVVPPEVSGAYQFQVEIELSDGQIFSKTSELIELL